MTVREAAAVLEVSTDLVYRLCAVGRLAHTRIGLGRGVIRIEPADVAELKASGRVDAGPAPPANRHQIRRSARVTIPDVLGRMEAKRAARKISRPIPPRPVGGLPRD